jgi:hypothetical protein
MTPADAARQVMSDLQQGLSITQDRIETVALITTIEALRRFAELLESNAPKCHLCSGRQGDLVQVDGDGRHMHAYGACHTNGIL